MLSVPYVFRVEIEAHAGLSGTLVRDLTVERDDSGLILSLAVNTVPQ
jgi:hypothetical protein